MTVCNMAIEAGARAGMIACDQKTIDYCKGRPLAPISSDWDLAEKAWLQCCSDEDAVFDAVIDMRAEDIAPQVTWGSSPEMVASINDRIPKPSDEKDITRRQSIERALEYMGLKGGQLIRRFLLIRFLLGLVRMAGLKI